MYHDSKKGRQLCLPFFFYLVPEPEFGKERNIILLFS